MKNYIKSFVIIIILVSLVNAQGKFSSIEAENLTQELTDFRQKSLIPGFAVAIINEKGVVYTKGFGVSDNKENTPFTPLTINWIASISKTFIAFSVVKLVEQGKLNLDEPINSILPYKIVNPHFPNSPITVRHLVTHTSSINDSFSPFKVGEADVVLDDENDKTQTAPWMQENVEWHKLSKKISLDQYVRNFTQPDSKWYSEETFSKKEPGTNYEYSNVAASIAARVIEVKSGMSFIDFTKKYIFEPLKMKNTGWNYSDVNPQLVSKIYIPNEEKNPTGVTIYPFHYMTGYPASNLKTNINDLAIYVTEMLKGYNGKGKLLKKENYKLLFTPQINTKYLPKFGAESLSDGENNAVFWQITKDNEYYHLGGNIGIFSFIKFNPKTKTGSLGISNLRDDSFWEMRKIVYKYEQKVGKQ